MLRHLPVVAPVLVVGGIFVWLMWDRARPTRDLRLPQRAIDRINRDLRGHRRGDRAA